MNDTNEDDLDLWNAKVWRVRSADGSNEVGPVTLDQVRRGLDSGKLDTTAQLARKDSGNWLTARDIVNAAITRDKALADKPPPEQPPEPAEEISTVHVSDPDRTSPGVRMPSGRGKTPNLATLVPLVVVSMAIVAGASFAAFRFLGPRPQQHSVRTKLDVDRLPRRTVAVTEGRIRDDLEDLAEVPPVYLADWLAERACGGVSISSRLQRARGESLAKMHELGVVSLTARTDWTQALRCGAELAKRMKSDRHTTVTFEHDDDLRVVTRLQLDLEKMPPKVDRVSHTYGGLPGFCRDETPEGEAHCDAAGPAGFHDGTAWFFGTHAAIDAFASSYTSAHRVRSSNIDILAELARSSKKASTNAWLVRPGTIPWTALCQHVAPEEDRAAFLEACFPPTTRGPFDSAETKIRGLAIERDDVNATNRVHFALVLLARNDDAARWIEADLQDIRHDWRSHLVDNEPALIRRLKAPSSRAHDRLWSAAMEPFVRAIGDVRVERHGSVVRFEVGTELTPHERKQLDEFRETPKPEHDAMVEVLEAMSKGEAPAVEPLSRFLGAEVGAWAAAPRADEADCKPLIAKYESLAADPSALELVDLRDRLSSVFTPKACPGIVLTDDYRTCLTSAGSLFAFAACEPPRSPYATDAHRRLRGQWAVSSLDTRRAERWPYAQRSSVSRCRLEIGEHRIAFDCGGERNSDALRIEAEDLEQAVLYVPYSRKLHPKHIALGKSDDEWTMTDFARGVGVHFRKAKFDTPLLESD